MILDLIDGYFVCLSLSSRDLFGFIIPLTQFGVTWVSADWLLTNFCFVRKVSIAF